MGIIRKGFKSMFQKAKRWKIQTGDKVKIVAGKDKGQVGTVLRVIRDAKWPRVVVEGCNLVKRHLKQTNGQGGIITMSAPLHYSNVMHVDPVTNGPVRVSWRFLEDGTRVRLTKGKLASESAIPLTITRKPTNKPKQVELGPRDTPIDDVREQTHQPGELPTMLNAVLDGSYIMKRHVGGTTSSGSGGGRRGGGRQQQARGFAASAFQ